MSAIIGAVVGAVVLGALVPAGAKFVRSVVEGISSRFDVDFEPRVMSFADTGETIKPISKLRSDFKPIETKPKPFSDIDEVKREMFAALASTPLYTSDEEALKKKIATVERAGNIEDVRTAVRELSAFVDGSHQKVFGESIKMACERASKQIGFTKFETMPNRVADGQIRFAATDVLGRTLVTEINAPIDGDVRINTEVLGVSDDSCQKVLDEFYDAVGREGVEISGPPRREATGGVCASAAAKEFLALKMPAKRRRADDAATSQTGRVKRPNRNQRRDRIKSISTAS
jgi:hypothetical protein